MIIGHESVTFEYKTKFYEFSFEIIRLNIRSVEKFVIR
jgi:hypothetical protein